jgi:hypothetical protein
VRKDSITAAFDRLTTMLTKKETNTSSFMLIVESQGLLFCVEAQAGPPNLAT